VPKGWKTNPEFIEAIRKSGALIAPIAKMLGCSREHVEMRIASSPALQKAVRETTADINDLAQAAIITAINNGDAAAARGHLLKLERENAKRAKAPPPAPARGSTAEKVKRYVPYSYETAMQICRHISEGEPLTDWCNEPGNPSYGTVMDWLVRHQEFEREYTKARDRQADNAADRVGQLSREVVEGRLDAARGRVAIDAQKWIAATRAPRRYSEKFLQGDVETKDAALVARNIKEAVDQAFESVPKPAQPANDHEPRSAAENAAIHQANIEPGSVA
jgi:hypothetical protein